MSSRKLRRPSSICCRELIGCLFAERCSGYTHPNDVTDYVYCTRERACLSGSESGVCEMKKSVHRWIFALSAAASRGRETFSPSEFHRARIQRFGRNLEHALVRKCVRRVGSVRVAFVPVYSAFEYDGSIRDVYTPSRMWLILKQA